jgi:hypothetical protein
MLRWIGRFRGSRLWLISAVLPLPVVAGTAFAQEISVIRLAIDTDMTVRLTNMSTHVSTDRSGDSYFIVGPGRYSVQLLRNGQVAYEEVEYIGPDAPNTRTVNPKREEIVVGLPEDPPQFESNLCAALEAASQLTITRYGLHGADVQRRISDGDIGREGLECTTSDGVDAVGRTISGSYGVTPLGMIGLSIEYSPLAGVPRPRNRGNSPIYNDPATQRLATTQQPNSNLTPSLVGDLKNGIADVAVDSTGKPLLVCGAINAFTPLFCDSNGLAVATPAIGHLRGLYRFSVKTTPVDHQGVELDHWATFVGDDEYHATQDKLAAGAQAIRQDLEQRIAQLDANSVTVPSARNPGQITRYYPTPELVSLITTTQASIDKVLRDATLQPLQQHFPLAISQVSDPSQPATREADAQRIFRELRNAITILETASGNLGMDLVFRTVPVETEGSRLAFDKCERCIPLISQGGEHRFYRGKYYIHVTLDGYAPYEGWLDLIEDPKTILECDMVRVHRVINGHGSSCSLRSQ